VTPRTNDGDDDRGISLIVVPVLIVKFTGELGSWFAMSNALPVNDNGPRFTALRRLARAR